MESGGNTRTRILEAAVRLFGERGPEAFSAGAIARATGVSKANVFHHFPRLEEIPLAALAVLAARMGAGGTPADTADLRSWLHEYGHEVFEIATTNRTFLNAYFVFFSKALFDERLREPLRRCEIQTRNAIETRLRDFHRPDAHAVAVLATATLDGLVLRLLALDDRSAVERAWSNFVDLVVAQAISQ